MVKNKPRKVRGAKQLAQFFRKEGKVMIYGRKQDIYGNDVVRLRLDDDRTTFFSPKVQK